jgi:hypothetical protein
LTQQLKASETVNFARQLRDTLTMLEFLSSSKKHRQKWRQFDGEQQIKSFRAPLKVITRDMTLVTFTG